MDYQTLLRLIGNALKEFDSEMPSHKAFRPGIGPFGEPQIVKEIAIRLSRHGLNARTKRTPDLAIADEWALEFKIVRPFGDNGKEAENWSVNMLHPYRGNVSLIGDAIKLSEITGYQHKGLFVIAYEHANAKIDLEPLVRSFEVISRKVMNINLGERIEARHVELVHPEHQVLRCVGWELKDRVHPAVATQ